MALLSAATLLAGCASPSGPMALSLTELGSEVQEDGGSWVNNLRHRRSMNVTGLGAADVIGMTSMDPDPPLMSLQWPFKRSHLPDQLALRFVPRACSQVVSQTLALKGDDGSTVATLRDGLQTLVDLKVRVLELSAEQTLALALRDSFPADGKEVTDSQALDARKALLTAWSAMSPRAPAGDRAGWQTVADDLGKLADAASAKVAEANKVVQAARGKPGIVVTTWEYAARQEGGLTALGIGASTSRASTRQGFAVLGDVRVLTLLAGEDLLQRMAAAKAEPAASEPISAARFVNAKDRYTTTYQLLAKHVAWSDAGTEDRRAQLSVQLKKVIDAIKPLAGGALTHLKDTLAALDVQISAASAVHVAGQNQGWLSGATEDAYDFSFLPSGFKDSLDAYRKHSKGYLRIVSLRSSLDAMATSVAGSDGVTSNLKLRNTQSDTRCNPTYPTAVSAPTSS